MLRLPVDFNTMMADEKERVWINASVHPDIASLLMPGLRVVLYEEYDIEVEAVLEFDAAHQAWLAQPDWATERKREPCAAPLNNPVAC